MLHICTIAPSPPPINREGRETKLFERSNSNNNQTGGGGGAVWREASQREKKKWVGERSNPSEPWCIVDPLKMTDKQS